MVFFLIYFKKLDNLIYDKINIVDNINSKKFLFIFFIQ